MSAFSLDLVSCEAIQLGLDRAFEAAPVLARDPNPVLDFITSATNRQNVLQTIVSPGNGKNFRAKVLYTPRFTENEASTSLTRACTSSEKSGNTYSECEIDINVGVESPAELIEIADLAAICEGTTPFTQNRIAAHLSVLRRKLETEITAQIAAGLGGFPDDDQDNVVSGLKEVQTLLSDGTTTDLNAIETIGYSKDNMGIPALYVFGSKLITQYFKRIAAGCCLDGFGVNFDEFAGQQGLVYSHSYRVPAAMGETEGFFAMVPGAAHLVYVNLYAGENTRDSGSFRRIVLTDPVTGIPFDFKITDTCDGIVAQGSLAFKVCIAPTDMFALDDRMSGVNGLLGFNVVNP